MKSLSFPPLVRIGLIGAATGSRSQSGIAALALTQPAGRGRGLSRLLGGDLRRRVYPLAAVGEIVVDKLPKTPSRLEPRGLVARVALGGLAGAMLGQRLDQGVVVSSVLGAASATATSYGGARFRREASKKLRRDLPGAVAEDVVALKLAWVAVNG
jgi:uncharacterized membrane protein